MLESNVKIVLNSICVTHDEAHSGWSWSLRCLDRVMLTLKGVTTSGIVLIVCDPKTSKKSVARFPLITVSARAEGPWPGLSKACVLWFPCVPQCLLQNCSAMWITKLLSRKAFY